MYFYIYENWTHDRVRLHRGNCSYCNEGKVFIPGTLAVMAVGTGLIWTLAQRPKLPRNWVGPIQKNAAPAAPERKKAPPPVATGWRHQHFHGESREAVESRKGAPNQARWYRRSIAPAIRYPVPPPIQREGGRIGPDRGPGDGGMQPPLSRGRPPVQPVQTPIRFWSVPISGTDRSRCCPSWRWWKRYRQRWPRPRHQSIRCRLRAGASPR